MTRYLTIVDCKEVVFSLVYDYLANNEPAPLYEQEEDGMEALEKVLSFVQNNDYYPSFYDKAAYILCSVAGSQYFSNGNKRLAVATLLVFLMKNKTNRLDADSAGYRAILTNTFTDEAWEENSSITGAHALFLYNLAIVIGNRNHWGTNDFSELKEKVSAMFEIVYKR